MRDNWFSRRVHPEGLEPSTNGLRGHCSTIEVGMKNYNLA